LELRALMRSVSLQGYVHTGKRLLPDECLKVCEFVIEKSASLHRRLNMRLLVNSFMDYLQWIEGDAGCHWQDLVASRLHERPTTFRVEVSRLTRAERSRQELELARRIRDTTADRTERLSLWEKETGKSEQTLYRRLEKLAEMEREEQARAESAEDK